MVQVWTESPTDYRDEIRQHVLRGFGMTVSESHSDLQRERGKLRARPFAAKEMHILENAIALAEEYSSLFPKAMLLQKIGWA